MTQAKGRRYKQSLDELFPSVAKEWHPIKNGNLTPKDVTPGSGKKVWWLCEKGHEWQEFVYHRIRGCGCPFCSGHRASKENCLQTVNPELAKEWHPTKNEKLTPQDVTYGSGKKVWWICSRGHEWQAVISSRTKGNACPFCHSQTSQLELRIYSELKYIFKQVEHRKRLNGLECDLFIPKLNFAIEVDGFYWHKNRLNDDKRKITELEMKGILLVRIRQRGLKRTSENDIYFSKKSNEFDLICEILKKISALTEISPYIEKKIHKYKRRGEMANDEGYKNLLNMLPSPLPGYSLVEVNPKLAKEWHPTRNTSLTPKNVSPGSHIKVWWICDKGHEWEAVIKNRNEGYGCPYCSGQAVCDDNCLQTLYPDLSKEWHPSKNINLSPSDVTPGSKKKVWWICNKGHSWISPVYHRVNGRSCPYCSGKKASRNYNLLVLNPKIAKEWHPTRNKSLTPKDVTPGSDRRVWWLCNRGHVWQESVYSRNKGFGCPFCAGKRIADDNCLQSVNSQLAKEWHPIKNGNLSPRDVTAGSNKKVWWLCSKGHEWRAVINDRNRGRGCPYCSGRRASKDNCLQTINPELAIEWHPINNKNLTPKDVTPHHSKKVWWLCEKGHEWQATVDNRSNGRGCPYCSGKKVNKGIKKDF